MAAVPSVSAFDLFSDACNGNADATVCQDSRNDSNPIYGSGSVVELVVNILSLIIGLAAVVIIIVAGIQYMLSTGDPTKVNNAKNAILYALVGLVVAVLARFIVPFILGRL
jgi:multisubunit Na+/H+ antiporter MnhB subunit